MNQLGLNYVDIGDIYGLYPIVTMLAASVSGKRVEFKQSITHV